MSGESKINICPDFLNFIFLEDFCIIYLCIKFLSILFTDTVTTMATGISGPNAIAFTPSVSLTYVLTDSKLYTVTAGGAKTWVAGSGLWGFANGQGKSATFAFPSGMSVHPVTGVIYIADTQNNRIRTCTSLFLVGTLAGTGISGNVDGGSASTTFNRPFGIVMDQTYTYLYVTCKNGNTLRQVAVSTGYTTTIAGSGASTSIDGMGLEATFNHPAYA